MSGDTIIRLYVIQMGSTLVMKMEMVFMRFMLTPLRGSDLSFAPGFALTVAFHRKGRRYI
jgi:hypothetical protein